MKWLRRIFFHDMGRKFLALALATFAWWQVGQSVAEDRTHNFTIVTVDHSQTPAAHSLQIKIPDGWELVSPEPGTPLAVGGEIQVLVSSGPEPRPVPAVEGLSVVAADARLQAAGFRQVEVEGPADGRVTSQDPASGYMGLPQTRVTLISK